jgi:hypothetical protein
VLCVFGFSRENKLRLEGFSMDAEMKTLAVLLVFADQLKMSPNEPPDESL